MKLKNPENLPQSMLKMILEQMVKEGLGTDDCEEIYESSSSLDKIYSILKKFGITDIDYEDFGFFAELFIENPDFKNSDLKVKKIKKYDVNFRVYVNRRVDEYYRLKINSYSRRFVRDMIDNGDYSYYDGELIDDDVVDSDTIDWNIENIELSDENSKIVNEHYKYKNSLLENDKERKKELKELKKLRMVIDNRIKLLS